MLVPMVISIALIIAGSFADWQISSSIGDLTNGYGQFIETFGMFLGYGMISVGGTLVYLGLCDRKRFELKFLGYFILFAATAATTFYVGKKISTSSSSVVYGYRVPPLFGYLIGGAVAIALSLLLYFILQKQDKNLLLTIGVIFLLAMLGQALFIGLIKKGAGRPRYRFLVDERYNTAGEVFKNFWEWSADVSKDDFHRSWPSGHSGTAAVLILLPLLHPLFKRQIKGGAYILYAAGVVYMFAVAYGRVRVGAHYTTDVGFGLLIGLFFSIASYLLLDRLYAKMSGAIDRYDEKPRKEKKKVEGN